MGHPNTQAPAHPAPPVCRHQGMRMVCGAVGTARHQVLAPQLDSCLPAFSPSLQHAPPSSRLTPQSQPCAGRTAPPPGTAFPPIDRSQGNQPATQQALSHPSKPALRRENSPSTKYCVRTSTSPSAMMVLQRKKGRANHGDFRSCNSTPARRAHARCPSRCPSCSLQRRCTWFKRCGMQQHCRMRCKRDWGDSGTAGKYPPPEQGLQLQATLAAPQAVQDGSEARGGQVHEQRAHLQCKEERASEE